MGGKYIAYANGMKYNATPRGNLKKNGKILVGDFVMLKENNFSENEFVITKVLPRENCLTRPPISNINQLIIVLAPVPKPDFELIDKLIISAYINNILPILVINKSDLAEENEIKELVKDYRNACEKVIVTSAKENLNVNEIKNVLKNNLSVFAGQSAVGKSSILNAITNGDLNLKTNGLSEKIGRGKHTTRHSEIFVMENDILVADTPGFSMLDLTNLNPQKLCLYYPDFEEYRENCKYNNCTHIGAKENECAVINALNKGEISKNRYNRYVELYKEYLENWRRKYD